ncbi:MAG TPA: tRNA (adenosine(37)-N6)-threonylcarbamoyltransferase complex dimerization subunit type 1 TsaB [Solirubrobacteraceae bacterium]|nr:tRNA (adenosine(37)-N6)-threonylcarbamoyltransferase complex dimerization subunit type 1 TsaB [Solirubrobacteraceae bacterium]
MTILAFDTATPATTVALSGVGDVVFTARHDPLPGERPGHATRLLPLVARVMERAGIGWDGVDQIAVGVGPGTFTGLRIGIATARALSRARSVPLIGVSTLQSLALGRPRADDVPAGLDAVLAVLDARRGEVFAASWRMDEADDFDNALLPPRAVAPEALADLVAPLGPATLAIGDGAIAFRDVLERSGSFIPEDDSPLHKVTATNHCRLADRLEGGSPDEVRPDYLRAPDAEIAHRTP